MAKIFEPSAVQLAIARKFYNNDADFDNHVGSYTEKDFEVFEKYINAIETGYLPLDGLVIGIAKGDNLQGAIRTLLACGYILAGPNGRVLTGNEKKKTGEQPTDATTQYGDVIAIFPPQDFPARLADGDVDVVLAAGYDIQVNASKVPNLNLNGEMSNPDTRELAMYQELKRTDCVPLVHMGCKPVVSVLMAKRNGNFRELSDLQGRANVGMSEYTHILREYGKFTNTRFNRIKYSTGGTEAQVIAGFADVGLDVTQSGTQINDDIVRLRLVRNGDGKIIIANYSDTWALASPKVQGAKSDKVENFSERISKGIVIVREMEPELFNALYEEGLARYDEREEEMGLN
jgi:hypothetical protein